MSILKRRAARIYTLDIKRYYCSGGGALTGVLGEKLVEQPIVRIEAETQHAELLQARTIGLGGVEGAILKNSRYYVVKADTA